MLWLGHIKYKIFVKCSNEKCHYHIHLMNQLVVLHPISKQDSDLWKLNDCWKCLIMINSNLLSVTFTTSLSLSFNFSIVCKFNFKYPFAAHWCATLLRFNQPSSQVSFSISARYSKLVFFPFLSVMQQIRLLHYSLWWVQLFFSSFGFVW